MTEASSSAASALWRTLMAAFAGVLALSGGVHAETDGDEDDDDEVYIAEFVENFDTLDGLFPLYTDPEDGSLYLEIGIDQLDQEFIYFAKTLDGVPSFFHFRGAYRDNAVLSLNRHYDTIEILKENTFYYHDPENPLSRAAEANISRAILAQLSIEAEAEDGSAVLVDAGPFFRSESLHQVSPPPSPIPGPFGGRALGDLTSDRTKIADLRNYPENTDIVVEYVYQNPSAVSQNRAVTDARAISIVVQHTLIAMPDNDYEPRFDDYRVGYFLDMSEDLTAASFTPYRDVINRWDLRKADPDAPVSDPVEPVVFWIENTTPLEFRDAIREGVLAWNIAFEAAGISNALEVRVQPDDADWDAGDIRYNVLRWTSSPNPLFGGYGPSFTNPRTGQILGADIMLEYVFVTNRVRLEEIYGAEGDAARALLPPLEPPAHLQSAWGDASLRHGRFFCSHGLHAQHNLMAARTLMMAQGASELEMTELTTQALRELTLHEVGHTLGLSHNMAASSGVPNDALGDRAQPPAQSVMDYNAVNLAAPGAPQGQYYMSEPGPYDIWAIQYGYTPDLSDEDKAAIAARSIEAGLRFGNDADDMRFPGVNIDPRIMTSDLGADSIAWADGRMRLVAQTLPEVVTRFGNNGDSYQDALVAFIVLTGHHASAAAAVSRWVGGVLQERALGGQEGASAPFTPVSRATQERALAVLETHIFAPDAFDFDGALLRSLQPQRRGFEAFFVNEDPPVHRRVLAIQQSVLAHLLHPNVLSRMTDTRLYGGDYPVADYLADLTAIMFDADINSSVSTLRQQLQIVYVERLLTVVSPGFFRFGHDPVAQSAALASLNRIADLVSPGLFGHGVDDGETQAHREHVLALLQRADVI